VLLTCLVSTAITLYVLAVVGLANLSEILSVLGLYPVNLYDVAKCVLLVSILFIGPLFEAAIAEEGWREWGLISFKETVFDSWVGWRNLVVGPVSEELVFRSLAISLFLLAQVSLYI
jgi:prenyl protein peptidase